MLRWVMLLPLAAMAQSPDLALGKKIFESQCALCHGQTGTGGRGPGLNRPSLSHAPDDAALRKLISEGIPPEMPGAWQLNQHEVTGVAAYVRSIGTVPPETLPGDPDRGAALFAGKGCAGCHIVAGKGEGIGPELTDIGARRNAAFLRHVLLNPVTSLPQDFLYVSVVTASGAPVRGMRVNEDSFTIQIKDTRGQFHSFRKSELKELHRQKDATPMPSYEGSLAPAEMDDLVAYLATLRKTR